MQTNIIDDFKPVNQLEAFLAVRIVSGIWRLKRLINIEKNLISMEENTSFKLNFGLSDEYLELQKVGNRISNSLLDRLLRYENSIERSIYKALHELQRLIASRNGENVTTSMAIDLNIENRK